MSGLFQELKRRNVFKVGAAYVVMAWLLAQITDVFLEPFGAPVWVIKTVLLLLVIGFPLALFFAWAFEMTPEGLKKEKDVDRSQSITAQTGRKLDFVIITILILALAYFAYDKFVLEREPTAELNSTAQQINAPAAEPATKEKSIAVLPFVNMSPDPDQEYFSDGISEEILNSLAKVKELKVAGRTSSFAFKGENQDLRQVGETLGVEHILEGSVRKSGTKIRITAQLIQVEDGFHLWSDSYDRELTDVFAIQDEISHAILEQLKAHLLDEKVSVTATRTNSEAYDLYLLARRRMYERTGPNIESAAELLDRAIALDPGYAPAYAQYAIAHLLLGEGGGGYGDIPREQVQTRARLYLDKALQLDPELAEGWAGMGLYYLNEPLGHEQALEALYRALDINPNLMDANNWLHNTLQQMGRPAEAYKVVMAMIEKDPLYRPAIRNSVNSFISFGQYDQARAFLDEVRPLVPNDGVMNSSDAALLMATGELSEGLAKAERAVELLPSSSVVQMTRGFGLLDSGQFERVVEQGVEFQKVYALSILGRYEEAAILAFELAEEEADVATLFAFLNLAGRSDEVISYLEQRWPDLAALERDIPPYGAFGHFVMINVALAYSRAGRQQRFDEALGRIQAVHRRLIDEGVSNNDFFMNEAAYRSLAGDFNTSLDFLDRAVSGGLVSTARIARVWPALEPLEGHPRYEAIQARMFEHLNSERAKLGLGPATI